MNGYANADTYFAAAAIHNIESLYIAARRLTNGFALRICWKISKATCMRSLRTKSNASANIAPVGIIGSMCWDLSNQDI